jgi:trigger factor
MFTHPSFMNVELENLPSCQATLRVEIPADKVSEIREAVVKAFVKDARLPGFRQGKAPKAVVEKKFSKDIQGEVSQRLLNAGIAEAQTKSELAILGVSNVELPDTKAGEAASFTATLTLEPAFDIPDYDGLEVKVPFARETEVNVEKGLEYLREQLSEFADVDPVRPAAMEDFIIVDYAGTLDGKPVEQVVEKAGKIISGNEDFWIRMTGEAFFPGFSEQLVGAEIGDRRTVTIKVPGDFPLSELADKELVYDVKLKSIKKQVLPELNDAIAVRLLGEGKTLDDLKTNTRERLEQGFEQRRHSFVVEAVMKQLVDLVECELPEGLLNREIRNVMTQIVRENMSRGITQEALTEKETEIKAAASKGAKERLKSRFILNRIAKKEKVGVSEQEVLWALAQAADQNGKSMDQVIREVKKNDGFDEVREQIAHQKVMSLIASKAKVTEEAEQVSS